MSASKTCYSLADNNGSSMMDHHSRCFLGKRSAVIFLVIYTILMGFMFLSYLYTSSDGRTSSATHLSGKDVIVIKKSAARTYSDVAGSDVVDTDGRIHLGMNFLPKPGVPSPVQTHFKSLRTGQPIKDKCKKCAVISSSGHMLGSKRGREIDSMPCVIRMNNSPVEGFEEDVGARTTLRIVCHMSTEPVNADSASLLNPSNKQSRPEKIVFFGLNEPNHRWALEKAEIMVKNYPEVDFYSLDEVGELEFDLIFQNETGKNKYDTNTWLSTGWYTILLALNMCEEVHMYGMVNENYCERNIDSKIRYHYFQTWDNPTECDYYKSHEDTRYLGGHRFITEKAIFSRWGAMFNLTFHQPDWEPPKLVDVLNKPLKTPFVSRNEEDKSAVGKLFDHFAKWAFGSLM
ncbi:alpha-N-acetyl-neuraminyl-2,3-beta-galactosyl-1,3-N-acetyl-galactosaminide alpha-2,6-sialyltransferase-like isoform X1 [Lytechinus pictus]|uniref:alpha-N-acetyl-neuraminyl-2,3-beta-galactosyl-1, 3-N-acetyl-galactosaminide alpha-2,6-sialyltransferase-like isoform X1 n=2 Tax=Lytechinus pictus TaxID=7653 RepID=UPI0030BA116C